MPTPPPSTNKVRRLVPARPHVADDARAYMPRIPWHYVALGVLSLIVVMGGYYLKQRQKAEQLRAAMVQVHQVELAEARDVYTKLREKLESLIVNAAATDPKTLVDPRLHLPGLRSGNGLYLRLPLTAAKTRAGAPGRSSNEGCSGAVPGGPAKASGSALSSAGVKSTSCRSRPA